MKELYYCYILSNRNRTVLYIGYTEDVNRRVKQHRNGSVVFTKRYNVVDLIYFETFETKEEAKSRERQLKN